MAERPDNQEELEQTRRGQFVQELLDSGRKSGAYLDNRTMRMPEIPREPAMPDDEEPTMLFSPVQDMPPEELYEVTTTAEEDTLDEAELDAFFRVDDLYDTMDADDPEPEWEPDWEPMQEETAEQPEEPEWEEELMPEPSGGILLTSLKTAIYIIAVLLGAVVLALLVWLAADDVFGLTDGDRMVSVTVEETDSVADVAQTLKEQGLIKYKTLFRLYCGLTDAERKIDPGIYELNDYYDYMALVNGMIATSGSRKTVTVTVPEGYEVSQILRLLADSGAADYDVLCQTAAEHDFEYDFLADIPYGSVNRLEGYLFPDTYEFYIDDEPERVLGKFLRNYDMKLTDDLYERLDKLNASLTASGLETPLTMHDILTVASMVEREAANASERTSIASVIYNRLRSPLFKHLEIDATVQYALGEHKKALTYADLEVDSPYNTYLCEGLPAGPIACPGLNSIKAALYPASTEYFYYALDKGGTHHFSKTRLEHEQFLASLEEIQ